MIHLAHANARQKAVTDMVVLLWAHLGDMRRDPLTVAQLSEWPQPARNVIGKAANHYLDSDVSDEAWTETVERIRRLIEAETGCSIEWTGVRKCPTCDGHGSRTTGETETPWGGPALWTDEMACPDCLSGAVLCTDCGERTAELVVGGVDCCRGCRLGVLAWAMGDGSVVGPCTAEPAGMVDAGCASVASGR